MDFLITIRSENDSPAPYDRLEDAGAVITRTAYNAAVPGGIDCRHHDDFRLEADRPEDAERLVRSIVGRDREIVQLLALR